MDQVTIDLMEELNKFGGHITQIRDAIQAKGVTSEGKLFKFADEINTIDPASNYAYVLDAVKRANVKGYSDSEVVDTLNNLQDKNQPPKPEPKPEPNFDAATATEIPARQFYNRSDLEGELNCPNVVKVGSEAFSWCNYNIVKLPKATDIDIDAFSGSEAKVLEIPSFVWKDNNLNLRDKFYNKYGPNKIIVADESVPPNDISFNNVSLEVYNHDSTKKWDIYSNVWKAV